MIIPDISHPNSDYGTSLTEPNQAISLKTIAYRVSCGQTTGLCTIPQSYGEDDEDEPDLNGMTAEYLDVMSDKIDAEYKQRAYEKSIKSRPKVKAPAENRGAGAESPAASSTKE